MQVYVNKKVEFALYGGYCRVSTVLSALFAWPQLSSLSVSMMEREREREEAGAGPVLRARCERVCLGECACVRMCVGLVRTPTQIVHVYDAK